MSDEAFVVRASGLFMLHTHGQLIVRSGDVADVNGLAIHPVVHAHEASCFTLPVALVVARSIKGGLVFERRLFDTKHLCDRVLRAIEERGPLPFGTPYDHGALVDHRETPDEHAEEGIDFEDLFVAVSGAHVFLFTRDEDGLDSCSVDHAVRMGWDQP